jgi:hypothetical protein
LPEFRFETPKPGTNTVSGSASFSVVMSADHMVSASQCRVEVQLFADLVLADRVLDRVRDVEAARVGVEAQLPQSPEYAVSDFSVMLSLRCTPRSAAMPYCLKVE